MNKRTFSLAGLIIFIIGVPVLASAFLLLSPFFLDKQAEYIFSCVCVSLIYLAFFLPVFIGSLRGNIAGVAVSGTVYYKGATIYSVITAADIVLVFTFLPIAVAIAAECVALFVLIIWIFMALLTKGHIDNSLRDEEIKKSLVMELRSKSDRLVSMTSVLDKSNTLRVRAEKIAENMRYLSPGNSTEARDLERRLMTILDTILMDGSLTSAEGVPSDPLLNKFNDFEVLYRERKSMH